MITHHPLKSFLLIIFLGLILTHASYPQPNPNSIYFEALGNGGLYSVNYDRLFTEAIGGRIGFMYLSELDFLFSSINDFIVLPIMFNYFMGSGNSKLEIGAGVDIVTFSGGEFLGIEGTSPSTNIVGTATLGYRYQKINGGFLFRAGFTPFFSSNGFHPFGGISLGLSF